MIAERQNYLLFDRMVAFHVQRGLAVPLNAADFYLGLQQRFPERDGMYFLPEQVSEYEHQRMQVRTWEQQELFVSDEKSGDSVGEEPAGISATSIRRPATAVYAGSSRACGAVRAAHRASTILDQNFIRNDDETWRVADPKKEADLERLRIVIW